MVQAKEAHLVASVLKSTGSEGNDLLQGFFRAHGRGWGMRIRPSVGDAGAPRVFECLQELWLEGMPCDIDTRIVDKTADAITWSAPHLVLSKYWKESGVEPRIMFELHNAWRGGFVEGLGGKYAFEVVCSKFAGDGRFEFKISKRS